jgi:surface-anchored protein
MSAGGHDHFNLGFSEEGIWEVELSVSGLLNGTDLLTDTETFTFQVGSVPEPSAALLGLLGTLSLLRRRR